MIRALPFAALIAVLLAPREAHASPTARLVYSRASDAESCPEESALRRSVASRVGYDPFFAWAPRTVVASVQRRKRDFVATVDLLDARGISHGARELRTHDDCGELLDAVALAIAIAIDPQSLTRPPASGSSAADVSSAADASSPTKDSEPTVPTTSAPSATPTEASNVAEQPPRTTPPAARGVAFEPSFGVVASSGLAPAIAAGFSAGAAARWRLFSAGVEARIDAPATKSVAGSGEVSSWLMVGAVIPCAHVGPFLGCAVAQWGSMQASSAGVPDRQSKSMAWWAAGARAGVMFPVGGSVLVRLRSDAMVNVNRAALQLDHHDVWTAAPLSFSLGADAVLHFQ